jgi:hypothetical protein
MGIPATITELIENAKELQISYRTLHGSACIRNSKGRTIKIPYGSLTTKYRDFLETIAYTFELSELDQIKYRYKPKLLSYDLYKTPELWAAILEINNMKSIIEFKPTEIKVFDPSRISDMLNEILILEGKIE